MFFGMIGGTPSDRQVGFSPPLLRSRAATKMLEHPQLIHTDNCARQL
jgi:hypothetical protein